jgi:hypothetical protein
MSSRHRLKAGAHDLAAEIVRRAGGEDNLGYVVHLSHPPTNRERLLLAAHRLTGKPLAIMPNPCGSVEEWIGCYGPKAAIGSRTC